MLEAKTARPVKQKEYDENPRNQQTHSKIAWK